MVSIGDQWGYFFAQKAVEGKSASGIDLMMSVLRTPTPEVIYLYNKEWPFFVTMAISMETKKNNSVFSPGRRYNGHTSWCDKIGRALRTPPNAKKRNVMTQHLSPWMQEFEEQEKSCVKFGWFVDIVCWHGKCSCSKYTVIVSIKGHLGTYLVASLYLTTCNNVLNQRCIYPLVEFRYGSWTFNQRLLVP